MSSFVASHDGIDTVPPVRRWRRLAVSGLVLALIFAVNHLEYHYRKQRAQSMVAGVAPVVRKETNQAGHNQIGIDESGLSAPPERALLTFAELGAWAFDPQTPATCPETIRALDGRVATCVGFMYPLEAGTRLREFCLLRTTQTCCYGPRPQYNQYLLVEMKTPVKFERFAPVTVTGRFFVDPQPAQGYIYRMAGVSVSSAAADEPAADAAQVARAAGISRFDFVMLGGMARMPAATVPDALLALDGKRMVMDGFVLNQQAQPVPQLVLAKTWWDGKAQGVPPTMYTAVTVFLRTRRDLPPAWKQKGVFAGTLRVTHDPALWSRDGIVTLRDAIWADPGINRASSSGPIIPIMVEAATLTAFLFLAFCFLRRSRGIRNNREQSPS